MIQGAGEGAGESQRAAAGGRADGVLALDENDAARLRECLQSGGVAVFPTDTVYGLGCDPENEQAVRRCYELKGRPADRPAAVMFFDRQRASEALPELSAGEHVAIAALLPGPVTLLLPNRNRRFPLACGPTAGGHGSLGLRVPLLGDRLAALGTVPIPMMQSSANLSGEPEARRLGDVPRGLLEGADLVLDGGELLGVASTVLDLRDYQRTGQWRVLREGALALDEVERALA
jgi:L-threonylcarbamoyladenylate synthase